MSIATELQDKIDSKAAIKAAIEAKGVTVGTVKLNQYASKVAAIDAQSWLNFIAVRNRTKTTIEAGDIDVSTLTGTDSARALFQNCAALTEANLNFQSLQGPNCLSSALSGCTNLSKLTLNLASLAGTNPVATIFTGTSNINFLTISGMSDNAIWNTAIANNNLFAQTTLSTCQNLTITVDILPNLYLAVMTSLNLASVVQVLGQLHDYAGLTAHTITFNRAFTGLSQSDYNLIDAAKTTANARNWTVAGLTYSM